MNTKNLNNSSLSIIILCIILFLSICIESQIQKTDIISSSLADKNILNANKLQSMQPLVQRKQNKNTINQNNDSIQPSSNVPQQKPIQSLTNIDNAHSDIDPYDPSLPLHQRQKLTLIGYASDDGPARHLKSFSKRYDLDLHLIGVGKPWGGFNDKINGFYDFIESIDNTHNQSIVLILDAYDTVPICHKDELLQKFNAFEADIVMSTGKDCWPDPNVGDFLHARLTEEEKEKYGKFFPWFLCPNSGAIMGKHDAMLSMFRRVQKLVSDGDGSCADFEGNKFSKNTQSDQRCYTTYYVELEKYNEYQQMLANITKNGAYDPRTQELDISKLPNINSEVSADGTVSKNYFLEHDEELKQYYKGITMKLDYANDLFLSMGGMMFMDMQLDITNKSSVSMTSKITNGTSCIIHGNGPGVILFRQYVKQIRHNGNLYIDDYVLRVGVDFFHWLLWWIIMPCERLSHWLSVTYHFDLGFHSTTFSEEVIWRFHVWTFVGIVILTGLPIFYWYKYRFRRQIKVSGKLKYDALNRRNSKNRKYKQHKIKHSSSINKSRKKSSSFIKDGTKLKDLLNTGLVNLEIMVHNIDGNTFPLNLKTQKKN